MNLTTQAHFASLNIRTEMAGDEPGVTAVDIGLRASLMRKDFAALFYDVHAYGNLWLGVWTDAGELRAHALHTCKLTREFNRVTATLGGDLFAGPVELEYAKLNKLSFTPETGGVADVKLRLQAHPTTEQIGQLSQMLGHDVDIALEAPDVQQEDDADKQPEGDDLLRGEAA